MTSVLSARGVSVSFGREPRVGRELSLGLAPVIAERPLPVARANPVRVARSKLGEHALPGAPAPPDADPEIQAG